MAFWKGIRGFLGAALLVMACLGGSTASAGTILSSCLMSFHFDFGGQISNSSGATSYTMTGGGTCETTDGLGKTITIAGGGAASQSRCVAMLMNGSYTMSVFPPPAPGGGEGEFHFVGTASAGAVYLLGNSPTLVGVGALAGTGLVPCLGGTTSLNFSLASLTFLDP